MKRQDFKLSNAAPSTRHQKILDAAHKRREEILANCACQAMELDKKKEEEIANSESAAAAASGKECKCEDKSKCTCGKKKEQETPPVVQNSKPTSVFSIMAKIRNHGK